MAIAALTVFLGGGVMLMSTVILASFFLEWRRTPGKRGLLPLHVWLVALSYDLLVGLVVFSGISGGDLSTGRAWIRVPALVFGLASMFVLVNFQRRTYAYLRRDHARARDAAAGADEP